MEGHEPFQLTPHHVKHLLSEYQLKISVQQHCGLFYKSHQPFCLKCIVTKLCRRYNTITSVNEGPSATLVLIFQSGY